MKRLMVCGVLLMSALTGVYVFAQETKGVTWKHGLSFQVRKAGQAVFTEDTPRFGAEVFLDKDLTQAVFISEKGSVGLSSAANLKDAKEVPAPQLFHGLEFKVRPVGEKSFEKAKKVSTEIFMDKVSDTLVYVTETGFLATAPVGSAKAPDKVQDPEWFHALEVKARKAGEKEFGPETRKISIEVYKDGNTGNLVYVTDAGTVALLPAAGQTKPAEVKDPVWYHAFEIKVRKGTEKSWDKDTKAFGIEVYKDTNANTLVYVCAETGAIAVLPAGGTSKPATSKDPKHMLGRSFLVRRGDEKNFGDKTLNLGAEVNRDENAAALVYVTELGGLAVIPAAK